MFQGGIPRCARNDTVLEYFSATYSGESRPGPLCLRPAGKAAGGGIVASIQEVQIAHGGRLEPANIATLEDELSDLWRAAAEDPEAEHPVMRASVLTLLAFVESEEAGRERHTSSAASSPRIPAARWSWWSNRASPALRYRVDFRPLPSPPGAREAGLLRTDRVAGARDFRARSRQYRRALDRSWPARRLVVARREISSPDYFRNILRITDTLLMDSARFPDPARDLGKLAGELKSLSAVVPVSDLNWIRMTPGAVSSRSASTLRRPSSIWNN